MFKKILIANRGEIAIRVAKACKELGISTVGVYSTIDKKSLHLRFMDETVWIGDSPAISSYLNIEAILEAAKKTKAEAIHPGYGFLAENEKFAKACEDAGIIFIGPSSKALSLVGDKVASRNTVKKVDVPIIPGMHMTSTDISLFKKTAEKTGYPVMIKASMGGGGKGMRVVHNEKDLEKSIAISQREALSSFGDDSIYLEKYIEEPRHIEFQVLRDNYGNCVHLFERECSIQRRHQKIIEETPSPALNDELRIEMGEAAKKVIEASDYTTAGTVEFLLDKNKKFYFLEVNARIQVEHPITEMVTGVDLVREQIKIAACEKLLLSQDQIKQNGHAIETRIYAEDPDNNFVPSPGKILFLSEPKGPGIRVDSGIYQGCNIPPHYDPILSKLIVWSENRNMSIVRISENLKEYIILGIKTNIGYLKRIIDSKNFASGDYDTHFIDEHEESLLPKQEKLNIALIAGALNKSLGISKRAKEYDSQYSQMTTPWQEIGKWEICSLS
ncbi:MAG: acetyl-CoA carboxylase biotin carboxylase subunit [Candidatus Cloacimonetes bacterium]|nr:acetyl-CoA carboxylase biotin carboxylase subunit [Candidatus Cloacimonadota bacterium]